MARKARNDRPNWGESSISRREDAFARNDRLTRSGGVNFHALLQLSGVHCHRDAYGREFWF